MSGAAEAAMEARFRPDPDPVATQLVADGTRLTVNRVQDCEPVLERCKALACSGIPQSPEFKLAASFPLVIVEAYCNRIGIGFHEFLSNPAHQRVLLNDPDLKYFRVWPGRI